MINAINHFSLKYANYLKKLVKIMRKTTFLIVGKHAVVEALKNPSRKIERVFLTEDAQKKLNRENQSLNLLKNINVFYKSRKELDNLCGRDETAHQGLVAEVEQLDEVTLKEFVLDGETGLLVRKDEKLKNKILEFEKLNLKSISSNCIKYFNENFSNFILRNQYKNFYESLIKNKL